MLVTTIASSALTAQTGTTYKSHVSPFLAGLIDSFLVNPIHFGRQSQQLLDSAIRRQDVRVALSSGAMPWLCGPASDNTEKALRGLLTTAFITGNMKQQLIEGKEEDRPVAGAAATLVVYGKIQERVPTFHVLELDHWRGLQSKDSLAPYIDSLSARLSSCPAGQR